MRAPGAGLSMRCCGGSAVYRITRIRRVVSPPPSSSPPRPLAVVSFRLPTDAVSSSPSLILSLEVYLPRVSSLSVSRLLSMYRSKRKTQQRPRPITRQLPPRSSKKQSESRLQRNHRASCRRRLSRRGVRFFNLACFILCTLNSRNLH